MFKELIKRFQKRRKETHEANEKYSAFLPRFANWLDSIGFKGEHDFGGTIEKDGRKFVILAGSYSSGLMVKIIGDSFDSKPGIDEFWEFEISRNAVGSKNTYMFHNRTEFGEKIETKWGEYIKGFPRSVRSMEIPANEDVFGAFEDVLALNPQDFKRRVIRRQSARIVTFAS